MLAILLLYLFKKCRGSELTFDSKTHVGNVETAIVMHRKLRKKKKKKNAEESLISTSLLFTKNVH